MRFGLRIAAVIIVLFFWSYALGRGRYDFRFVPKFKVISGITDPNSQTSIDTGEKEILGALCKIRDASGMWHFKGARGANHYGVAVQDEMVYFRNVGGQMQNKDYVIWVIHK